MSYSERAVSFACEGEQLIGILSRPAAPTDLGVIIVVGGPQYRVGSHRQFVLLARFLANTGITVFRFDYRGMGDSGGDFRDFTAVDSDLRAAVDALQQSAPGLKRFVLWGLCDAASAAIFYAPSDRRINGLVLANPWVRTEAGEAQAYLSHYYRSRVVDARFWKKIFSRQFDFVRSISSFAGTIKKAIIKETPKGGTTEPSLREKMYASWTRFSGNILVLISGEDLTAKEFTNMIESTPRWRALLESPRVMTHRLPLSDHTFSREEWRHEIATVTSKWIKSLPTS